MTPSLLSSTQIPKLYREVIKPKFPNGAAKSWDILEGDGTVMDRTYNVMKMCMYIFCTDGLKEAKDSVLQLIPDYATCVIKKVSQECVTNLEPAHTIPRLYRRTNKEVQFHIMSVWSIMHHTVTYLCLDLCRFHDSPQAT